VELIHDLEPIEVSDSEVQKFKMQHGDKCDMVKVVNGLQNSRKAHAFSYQRRLSLVGARWLVRSRLDGRLIAQTDRATLWALVCTQKL